MIHFLMKIYWFQKPWKFCHWSCWGREHRGHSWSLGPHQDHIWGETLQWLECHQDHIWGERLQCHKILRSEETSLYDVVGQQMICIPFVVTGCHPWEDFTHWVEFKVPKIRKIDQKRGQSQRPSLLMWKAVVSPHPIPISKEAVVEKPGRQFLRHFWGVATDLSIRKTMTTTTKRLRSSQRKKRKAYLVYLLCRCTLTTNSWTN